MQWWYLHYYMGVEQGLYILKQHESRAQVVEMCTWQEWKSDKVRNDDIRQSLKQEAVMDIARKKLRTWKVKVEGVDKERLASGDVSAQGGGDQYGRLRGRS